MLGGVIQADTFTNGSKIYLKPNNFWKQDNAAFRAKFYHNSGDWWVSFTSVSGVDGLYECTVPGDNYYAVNIVRFPPDKAGSTNEGDKWNAIWNIPASNGKNLITVNDGIWDGDNSNYSWGTYSGDTYSYYYLRGSNNDYAAGKRVPLTWNSTKKQYEGSFTLTENQWICKVVCGKSANADDAWYGPSSNRTVTGQTDFALEQNKDEITFKRGTYYLFLKTTDETQGKAPTHLYITGGPTPAVPSARPTSLYFYSNNFGALGEKVPLMVRSADGKTFTYRFNYTANTPIKFNFRELPSEWRGARVYPVADATQATLSTDLTTKYDIFNADPKNMWSFTSESGDPVTVTVTFTDVKTAVLKVTQAPAPSNEPAYYIHAGFINNWDRNQRVKFMQLGSDPKVLTASVRYHEYNPSNKGFKITTLPVDDNGTWYSTGGELKNGVAVELKSEKGNMTLYESALGKAVTYTLTLDANNKPVSIKAEWVGDDPIVIGNQMPVFPIGVYTNTAFKRYDEWPVLYLKGRVLNDMRVTPEYQLTQITPTKYELEFTARNSKTNNGNDGQYKDENYSVIAYLDANSDPILIGEQSLDLTKTKTYNDREHDGTRYKAICEKGANGNWTFTLQPVGNVDDIPFISMVGQDWYQRDNYKTPYGNKYTNEDPNNSNSKWGWQESWIQYDSNGQVLKDRKGNVMYNTMWPPRNPVLFRTEFSLNGQTKNFSLSSKDITLVKVGTKNGSAWKNDPIFSEVKNKEKHDKSKPSVHNNALALDDNTEYTLYRVENMWINGHVKIWTGWGGVTYNNRNGTKDLANWDFHTNWGHYQKGGLGDVFEIPAGATVPLSNEYGDMEFDKPTFFKYVDLFIDNSKQSNEHGYSVLFTELATGGAQIAALSGKGTAGSDNEYEVGNYQASLNNLSNVKNGIVKNVVINCYSKTTNEMVDPVFSWNWDGKASTKVANTDFHTIFNGQSSMIMSGTNIGSYNANDEASQSKWVLDKNNYVSGDYFYRMIVTLSEDSDGLQTHRVTVDSNPFTIIKPETIDLDVYQLVKVEDNVNEDGVPDGGVVESKYYTYRSDPDDATNTKSLLPIYELKIKNDDKFDGESYNFEYDDNGNMIGGYIDDSNYEFTSRTLTEAECEALDFSSSNLQVTDKILIVGSKPTVNSVNGYKFTAENENGSITPPVDPDKTDAETAPVKVIAKNGPEKEGGQTEEFDQSAMRPEQNNRFMHVTNAGTFNSRKLTLQMQYLVPTLNSEGIYEDVKQTTPEVEVTYQPVIPEPSLVDAKVEVFYGTNGTEDTDDDTAWFKFANKDFKARFHNVRDYIEIEYPNVSRYMMERMRIRDFFTITMYSDDEENPDQQWTNVFNFGDHPDPVKQTSAVATGDFMLPREFNRERTIDLISKTEGADGQPLAYMKRWGDPKKITPIEVSHYAPNNLEYEIVKYSENGDNEKAPKIDRDENGDLISEYTIKIKHKDNFNPNDPNHGDTGDHDDSYYETLDEETGLYPERHNFIYHEGKDDLKEVLHHHTSDDYYYVAIVELEENEEIDIETSDTRNIIDANGLKSTSAPVNTGDKQVKYNANELKHYVIPASELLSGNSYEITIRKNYGQEGDWSTDFGGSAEKARDYDLRVQALGKENHFSKNIHVLISYLYPFQVKQSGQIETPTTSESAPARANARYSGNVLKSTAAVLNPVKDANDSVITGVNSLNAEQFGSVKVGEGFIEVEGIGVQVVNASGMLVGEGAGHHDVAPGVYVVRYNGKTKKVVVR